ncbi:MAG: wax ester/triacylglycerol synthase family O-acyltransferase, partial [Pseudomonadales bacterium]
GYDYERLIRDLNKAPHKFPMLKWKIQRVPFGFNHPIWVQDLNFDISHHIKRIACPGAHDKRAFSNLISELYAQPLDQSRPLWQIWVIEDLPDDQVAVVTLLHHAYADGAGASILMQGLLSPDSEIEYKSSEQLGVNPYKNPSWLWTLTKGLIDLPIILGRHLPKLVSAVRKNRRLVAEYEASGRPLPADPGKAPDSPLNIIHSPGRTFSYDVYELNEFKLTSKLFGASINGLLVAVVAGAVRKFYLENGYNPVEPLVAIIPINARNKAQEKEVLGNQIGSGNMYLPIHLEDPIERLEMVKDSARTMKEHRDIVGGKPLTLALEILPSIIAKLSHRQLVKAKGQLKLLGNMGISNVKGPTEPMKIAGGQVGYWLSIGQITSGIGLNITAWSYVDTFSVCIMADPKVIKDGPQFMNCIREVFEEYRGLHTKTSLDETA